jgi:hypothetical protein
MSEETFDSLNNESDMDSEETVADGRAFCASLCGPGCTFDHFLYGDRTYIHCMPCRLGSASWGTMCGNRHCIKFSEDRRTNSQILADLNRKTKADAKVNK